jgi:hypothetical protein
MFLVLSVKGRDKLDRCPMQSHVEKERKLKPGHKTHASPSFHKDLQIFVDMTSLSAIRTHAIIRYAIINL